MKRVLIIGYFWPYRSGSKRVIGLSKYLPEFGWQPTVLTAPFQRKPNPRFKVIVTPYRDIIASWKKRLHLKPNKGFQEQIGIPSLISERKKSFTSKLTRFIEGIITYPDVEKGWKPFAIKVGGEFLEKEKIDAIISIWPVTSHLIAKELKNKYKIPWIADFPDLWSQNAYYPYGILRKLLDRRLELKTIKWANALVTTSQPLAEKLKKLHKQKLICAITHGFDPEKVNFPPSDLTKKFTITYTGVLYSGKQDPSKLFIAIKDLISQGIIDPKDVEIRLYGRKEYWVAKEIKKYKLSTIVHQYGIVSRDASLEEQNESQILLLLNWEDPREKGVYTGKIFEYLAARRPILVTGGYRGDVVEKLIQETQVGIYCPKIEDIKKALEKFYSEYRENGRVTYHGNWTTIQGYSHKEMAKKFANILNQITI